jgi:diketogulonate reductase-like aldo/keto reductase
MRSPSRREMTTSTSTLRTTLNNAVELPALGLGVFQSPPDETLTAVEAAIEYGYRLVDTAAAYGNEREVGEAIRRSGIDRAQMFVTTKLWISDYGYEPALAVSTALKTARLRLRRPLPPSPGAERLRANGRCVQGCGADAGGRARACHRGLQLQPAAPREPHQSDGRRAGRQPGRMHPFFAQQALRDFHAANGIVTQAWSPIGGVNRYSRSDTEAVENPLEHPTILELAAKYQKTPAQVVLRWHIEHGVSAIPKSVKPHRIAENLDVFDFALAPNEVTAIDALDTGVRGGPDPELIDTKFYPFKVEN